MNIVIIEDEELSGEDLAEMIDDLQQGFHIQAILRSIKEAVAYLNKGPNVQLIFSDIQLGDGLSFEIFKAIKTTAPIIFCTAYDNYAIEAFKTNGIDFILKPFDSASVAAAVNKYFDLRRHFTPISLDYNALISQLTGAKKAVGSILIRHREKIVPIGLEAIALFHIDKDITRILCLDGSTFPVDQNLDELEHSCGEQFFRVNRQMMVNRKAVKDAAHYFPRKYIVNITVPFKDPVTVSKNRATAFLQWLQKK